MIAIFKSLKTDEIKSLGSDKAETTTFHLVPYASLCWKISLYCEERVLNSVKVRMWSMGWCVDTTW